MHYFQFNIGDYASHTRHLTLMEDLAYRRMLDAYYLREGELPLCAIEVGRIISMRHNISDVEQVLSEFFERTETGWFHKRAEAEIAHFRDKRQKASNAGKASAERRSNGRSTDVQPTNNQEPITINQEPDITPHKPPKGPTILIPDWMPMDAWNGWIEIRVKRKKPLTARAASRAIMKLEDMRCAGQDIAEVLDRSTMNGWTDLYEIKERDNGKAIRGNSPDRRSSLARAIDEGLDFLG